MRGKDGQGWCGPGGHRITPAYAGKSRARRTASSTSWDHPRVCGEKPLQSSVNCTMEGSPPRMRGKVLALASLMLCHRDHPRVCGEKPETPKAALQALGSPPRMRGKECREYMGHLCPGITPAYAGKRFPSFSPAVRPRDHPRVCGEKLTLIFLVFFAVGSPPRMRGKVGARRLHHLIDGITPAYAGKRIGSSL